MFVQVKHLKNEEFWCANCDCELVKSNDLTTGKIWSCHGHVYDGKNRKVTGDWPMVIFALCNNCCYNKNNLFQQL